MATPAAQLPLSQLVYYAAIHINEAQLNELMGRLPKPLAELIFSYSQTNPNVMRAIYGAICVKIAYSYDWIVYISASDMPKIIFEMEKTTSDDLRHIIVEMSREEMCSFLFDGEITLLTYWRTQFIPIIKKVALGIRMDLYNYLNESPASIAQAERPFYPPPDIGLLN